MQSARKNKVIEMQSIISKMSLDVFCVAALPEFGVQWREVAKSVRNARLPMQPSSVARVLCKHVSKALSQEEIEDIVARLRLKLIATQTRMWHVVRLFERTTEESVTVGMRALPDRVMQALQKNKKGMRPEVQAMLLGDFMYLSVQLVSDHKESSVLYVVTPLGEPVVLVSTANASGMLKACVEGLGYKKYENANLYGHDIKSLLQINNSWNTKADHLAVIPEYDPVPVVTENGIDYTNRKYDENYVESLLGPDPPLLTDLKLKTTKMFFDRNLLNKSIKLSVNIKSDDISKTLKSWVSKGAIAPTSDFFHIFREIKSNKINYTKEDSD